MERSAEAAAAWRRFCEGVTGGRVEEFDDIVSEQAAIVIGTAPGEIVTDRAAMRFGFETEGVTLQCGDVQGFAEGSMGWAVDGPIFGMPDGGSFDCRVTSVLRNEDGVWRLVHAHFSVGVPDEQVVELQQRWAASA